jgi:ubiquinol-cytochrome c reductase cytochrome c1 subunit
MKKLVTGILSLAVVAGLGFGAAVAQDEAGGEEHAGGTPHYPIHKPEQQDWTFAGLFGHYDKGQLQRGLKV